jgi:hypothetical protein
MKRIPKLVLAGAAVAALAGTAAVADSLHHMTLTAPDGGRIRVDYAGATAPTVHFLTPQMVRERLPVWSPFAEMEHISAAMDAMSANMDRQMAADLYQARQMMAVPAPGLNSATLRSLPAGTQSWSVTTISNGKDVCTHSTRVVSHGNDARPQVISSSSGDCNAMPLQAAPGTQAVKAQMPHVPAPRRNI